MADHINTNGNYAGNGTGLRLKVGLAEMLKGGVIMDVMNVEQAKIAEQAGAVAVMALERVPAMIRAEGGVARMANPKLIKEIIASVSIPVMAKARIGHFAEAQILQYLGVDFIDESEVLTMADETHHIDKHAFKTPFVCGARDLGEALRRIAEGAAMIRTKGEAGTGDVVHAVKHMRQIVQEMRQLTVLSDQELYAAAKEHRAPYELVRMVAKTGKLPVPNFSAGGIATPADAALMMQLGAESVFVGSGIFMKERATPLDVEVWTEADAKAELCGSADIGALRNPEERAEAESRAKAIVIATTHFDDPKILSDASEQVIGSMKGLAVSAIEEGQLLQTRGN
jgi:pyridoxal 5'-phosphate synthase pdxS subunit